MGKIRHIAYRAADVEKMANFFVEALGMKITQKRKSNSQRRESSSAGWEELSSAMRIRMSSWPLLRSACGSFSVTWKVARTGACSAHPWATS